MYLYREIEAEWAANIAKGLVRPGEAMPSVREMCRRKQASPATILAAYARLEGKGLIQAKPRSGYYVSAKAGHLPEEPRISSPSSAPTSVQVGDWVMRMLRRDIHRDQTPLGAAFPALELLPSLPLSRHYAKAGRVLGREALAYVLPPGNPDLLRQIARHSWQWGAGLLPEETLITSGCLEALTLGLRAVARAGDIVAIESPTYFAILQAMENLGMRALEIPTHPRKGMDLDALATAMKKHSIRACLLAPNFNNPLGSLMPDSHKSRLVHMLGKAGIPLIEDDIYGDLHFGEKRPKPAKAFDRKGLVIYCASFSKTLDPGARIGWVSGGKFHPQIMRLKVMNTLVSATLPQAALAAYLETGAYEKHLRRLRVALKDQVQHMVMAAQRHFPEGTRISRPQGGFTLWVEFPQRIQTLALAEAAEREGISLAPGPIFSAGGHFRHCLRLSCGHPWTAYLEEALRTVGKLCHTPG